MGFLVLIATGKKEEAISENSKGRDSLHVACLDVHKP
jgi:hypothetical protein